MFFGVPTMYHRLVASGRGRELAALRLCVSGRPPLPPELHAEASAAVGSAVLERYGMTETLMNVSNPVRGRTPAGHGGVPPARGRGPAGRGATRSWSGGRMSSAATGSGRRPNADAFAPAADGGPDWFRTGDIGADDRGYLVIRGRSKELIISGGMNVYPAEVEDVLAAHPGVAEVAVTGTPSDEWGEVVTAWVVADGPTPSLGDLVEFSAAVPGALQAATGAPRGGATCPATPSAR